MGLMDQIKSDVQQFTSNTNDFGVMLTFTSPTSVVKEVAGYFADHSLEFDENGNPIVGRKTTVCISEQSLIDAGYSSVRNSRGLITLDGHFVSINTSLFSVEQWQPDYTINLITLFLVRHNG